MIRWITRRMMHVKPVSTFMERNKLSSFMVVFIVAIWILYTYYRIPITWSYYSYFKTEQEKTQDDISLLFRKIETPAIPTEREMEASRNDNNDALNDTDINENSGSKLKIMTWNLQGLKRDKLEERTKAVVSEILRADADAVLFQELISSSYKDICKDLHDKYECIQGRKSKYSGYFVGILYKKSRFTVEDHSKILFTNSVMDRLLLIAKLYLIGPVKTQVVLMTSHLESLPRFSKQRVDQLKECLQIGNTFPQDYNVIFGGDLNLEEGEDTNAVPSTFKDLWKECGSPENIKYTWDATQNHNEHFTDGSGQEPRVRYDRLYFRPSNPNRMYLMSIELLGKNQVEGTQYFPSDHWALLSTFQVTANKMDQSCKPKR